MLKQGWTPYDTAAIEACLREWYRLMLEKHGEDLSEELHVEPSEVDAVTLMGLSDQVTFTTHVPFAFRG